MPTYYEILKVSPTATAAEIQSAYEAQRAQLERFVNHPNAQTVSKARQWLQFLPQVPATLLDPEKRKVYDASIGLVAGLADPHAVPQPETRVPPPTKLAITEPLPKLAPVTNTSVDAWVCPKCQSRSPIGSRRCKDCGQALAYECPQCDELVENTATFCSVCGFDLRSYTQPLNLTTMLTDIDDKLAAKIKDHQEKTSWRHPLDTEEVRIAIWRNSFISLGMVRNDYRTQFSIVVQCEQATKVHVASDSTWLSVDRTELVLEANKNHIVKVNLDVGNLERGQAHTGVITFTTVSANPTTVKQYVMLGIKKFLGDGDAKARLTSMVPAQLESMILGPAFVNSMIREARQAAKANDPSKRAAAYASAVRFMANPRTDPTVVVPPYKKSTPRITALAQHWHRLVSPLLTTEISLPGSEWMNWDPQVHWIEPIPFHFLPLWEVEKEKRDLSTITSGASGKILYPIGAELAVDCLTGELYNAQLSSPILQAGDGGIPSHSAADIASDDDFTVRADKNYLIATQGEHPLWESKVGSSHKIVIGQHHVYSYEGPNILALDRSNGKQVWKAEFNQRTYYTLEMVEVNGILIAMYMQLFSTGSTTNDYQYLQHLRWWDADTGSMQKTFFLVGEGKDVNEFKTCYAVAPIGSTAVRVVSAYKNHIYDILIFNGKPFRPGWGNNWTKIGQCLYQELTYASTDVDVDYLRMLGQHTCLVTYSHPADFSGTARGATIFDLQTQRQSSGAVGFPWKFSATTVGGVLILHSKGQESNDTVSAYV